MQLAILIFIIVPLLTSLNLQGVNAYWKPKAGLTWNWVLGDNPNKINFKKGEYDVIDIDLFNADGKTIQYLHDIDIKVICYFSAGTYEPFRKESSGMRMVEGLVRTKMKDWEENWLDFRVEAIKPFMIERLDLAKEKGCDGIEFDNVDAFTNVKWKDRLTAKDQLQYNRWLAQEAHARDLSAGLKNCLELVKELVDDYDFAINEQCSDYYECQDYHTFLKKDKAVFAAFYGLVTDKKFMNKVCRQMKHLNISAIIKDPDEELHYDYLRFDEKIHCSEIDSDSPPSSSDIKKKNKKKTKNFQSDRKIDL
ncbi:hypothetical protein BCR36DRAFT_337250 [Piromyces finnis]|uniref:alpha-galactosidase n=1 Tax=Piromyces finnis TaxID=1754191 RepID=A0A1Y1UY64_9FUNG|nr:hypothetical protein BCR36DRAFT_337250 [Piromyces finnis]|eukprot:ORX42525.1 hypothetical protein BCR36DRAFT_337250 [Piromyces finnis]